MSKQSVGVQILPGSTGVTTWDNTSVSPSEYQTVTAHGNAAVSDGATPTTMTYSPGQATLASNASKATGIVHIPFSVPIGMSGFSQGTLQNIIINFTSTGNASISTLDVYYDANNIFTCQPNQSSTFSVALQGSEITKAVYSAQSPAGICVSLTLNFPASSSIILESVQLVYIFI